MGCMLGFLDFRLRRIDWRTPHPNFADFLNRLTAEKPAFADTAICNERKSTALTVARTAHTRALHHPRENRYRTPLFRRLILPTGSQRGLSLHLLWRTAIPLNNQI